MKVRGSFKPEEWGGSLCPLWCEERSRRHSEISLERRIPTSSQKYQLKCSRTSVDINCWRILAGLHVCPKRHMFLSFLFPAYSLCVYEFKQSWLALCGKWHFTCKNLEDKVLLRGVHCLWRKNVASMQWIDNIIPKRTDNMKAINQHFPTHTWNKEKSQ